MRNLTEKIRDDVFNRLWSQMWPGMGALGTPDTPERIISHQVRDRIWKGVGQPTRDAVWFQAWDRTARNVWEKTEMCTMPMLWGLIIGKP
jgi:hypothetical protein